MTNRNRKILSGWSFLFLPAFSRPPPFLHSGITPNFHKTEEVEIYRKQTDKEYFPSGAVQKWRHQSRVRWRGSAKRKKNIPRWQAGVIHAAKNGDVIYKQPIISESNVSLFYARDQPRMETNKFPHNVAFSLTWILRHRRRLPPFVTRCLKNPNCTTLPVQNEIAPILETFLKTQGWRKKTKQEQIVLERSVKLNLDGRWLGWQGWRMTICKRPDPPYDHLQMAISSR